MRIVLDAMGGDHAPEVTIHGAVWAARDFDIQVQLVGRPQTIEAELRKHDTAGLKLPITPAREVIDVNDPNPAKVLQMLR